MDAFQMTRRHVRLVLASASALAFGACAAAPNAAMASLVITASGEDVARDGYAFPPANPGAEAFVDGWSVAFDHVVVSVGEVTLSASPDLSASDELRTGAVVARATGPWLIDLAKAGAALMPPTASHVAASASGALPASGRGSRSDASVRVVTFENLNVAGDAFDPDVRYALGFDTVPARADAALVNLEDDESRALARAMTTQGATVAYVGTARWRGGDGCVSSDRTYDWSAVPTTVHFSMLFKAPAAYVNCQNSDLEGKAFSGEERQRGVQIKAGQANFAQLTFHTDHAFWLTADHDAALPFFDQVAIAAKADGTVTLDDLAALDPIRLKDRAGKTLPWRSCLADVPVAAGLRRVDVGSFGVPFDPAQAQEKAIRNQADVMTYVLSAQGHLNEDGLCALKRNYPSP